MTLPSSSRYAVKLTQPMRHRRSTAGYPCMVVSDNGTELTSECDPDWQQQDRKVEWHYIAPGKPMQNSLVETSTVDCEDECLNGCSQPATLPAS